MNLFFILEILSFTLFALLLSYYLYTNLQWYSYKLKRVVINHHKWHWHILYFILPLSLYYFIDTLFLIYFYLAYLPSMFMWYKRLDKKLIFTSRVQRFFALFALFLLLESILCLNIDECQIFSILLPLIFALAISHTLESILLKKYTKIAKNKLHSLDSMKIITITGSFGKTSLKNFTAQILSSRYKVYATPRSVNTFAGVVADINRSLSAFTEIYIVEAGARVGGDIEEISQLVEHHYAILGKIGEQHIEYFKTIENITNTKCEIFGSNRLKKAFIYDENLGLKNFWEAVSRSSQLFAKSGEYDLFPGEIREKSATLEGLSFELKIEDRFVKFECDLLGEFNISNISAAIFVALEFGIEIDEIISCVKALKPIPHRLQKMVQNGKTIIDDSYNGNIDGMLEGIRLSSLHKGRKVIVTPGLVESNDEQNIELAKNIDRVFDLAIITGELNSKILSSNIQKIQKIILKDKKSLENVLKGSTREGDLILFANDAPSYI